MLGVSVGLGSTAKRLTDQSVLFSTMTPSKTAAQNAAIFESEVAQAISEDKVYFLPAGDIPFGYADGSQVDVAVTAGEKCVIRGFGPATRFLMASGSSAIPIKFSTLGGAVDYVVTTQAVSTAATLSTDSEVTALTLTSAPASIVKDEMVSVFSNDLRPYAVTYYERNYQHEMAQALSISGSVLTLSRKLKYTYSVANYVRLRRYNNVGAVLDIDDVTFTNNGNIYDNTIEYGSRPFYTFEVIGFQSPRIGKGVVFEHLWTAGPRISSCIGSILEYRTEGLINGLDDSPSDQSVLGYAGSFDGAGLMNMYKAPIDYNGRHCPTIGWGEEVAYDIDNASYSAGASTVLHYTLPAGASSVSPAIGDYVYVDMSGVTGTINTMPIGWYPVTAVNTGSRLITVTYDSTGKTYSSGTGRATLFQPNNAHRYGEQEFAVIEGNSLFAHAIPKDSHENAYGTMFRNNVVMFPVEEVWNGMVPGAVTLRGWGEQVDGLRLFRGTTAINVNGFQYQRGMDNTCTLKNLHFSDQQDRAEAVGSAGEYYIKIEGHDGSVTDKQKCIVDNLITDQGTAGVFYKEANSGTLVIKGWKFFGDWSASGASSIARLIRATGGVIELVDCYFDFSDVTGTYVYLGLIDGAAEIKFTNCKFMNIKNTSDYLFSCSEDANGTAGYEFNNCLIHFNPSLTDGTGRFAQVIETSSGVTTTCYFRFINTHIQNAAKLSTSFGLIKSQSGASLGTAIAAITRHNLTSDAAFTLVTTTNAGASYTITEGAQSPTVRKLFQSVTAVGNVGTGEDNLINTSLARDTLFASGKGVRITAWGTAANNANAKTVKLYFGSAVILTTALTANQAGVWRIVADVFSTGTDAQIYIAQLNQGGTTTLVDVEQGTLTQDDGATITVKCTGEATTTDDISQKGMYIEHI